MDKNTKNKLRSMEKPGWYWIDREIITVYGKRLRSSGIAVYNALASYANQKTQTCFPSQQSIAELLGLSRMTVNRKIKQLKELGLLDIMKLKSHCSYFLLRPDVPDPLQPCDKKDTGGVSSEDMNNNNRTKINNNDIDNKNILAKDDFLKGFEPKTREELLALDMAEAVNDLRSLPLYLNYAKTLPEPVIRETLSWIKRIPDKNIRKSRASLFNFILKQHVKKISSNHRH
jgi:DNA-binding Lrp family transcriptional regulator